MCSGPNEYHKGEMTSLVGKRFAEAKGGQIGGACSNPTANGIGDGEQEKRDFIYVDDAGSRLCAGCSTRPRSRASSMSAPARARSFRDLISAMFRAPRGAPPDIEYVDMAAGDPRSVSIFHSGEGRKTCARAGYNADFHLARGTG